MGKEELQLWGTWPLWNGWELEPALPPLLFVASSTVTSCSSKGPAAPKHQHQNETEDFTVCHQLIAEQTERSAGAGEDAFP